jgi:hypothetical protein
MKIKREINIILVYECHCDERLRAKDEGSIRLAYTVLRRGLEHLQTARRRREFVSFFFPEFVPAFF